MNLLRPPTLIRTDSACSLYFGKIPSRGDFVKSATAHRTVARIDHWATLGIELLITNSRWKSGYDNSGPIDFLFVPPQQGRAICGTLIASRDASARRFPFVAATLFTVDDALAFLPLSPLMLERHSNRQRALAQHAASSQDASDALATLDDLQLDAELPFERFATHHRHFLLNTTIGLLDRQLGDQYPYSSLRQMVLALGLLLQPVLADRSRRPQKGLSLPLPRNLLQANQAKAFWLELVRVFMARTEFELGIFCCTHAGRNRLIVTFNGAAPDVFQALYDEQAAAALLIDVGEAEWVEEFIGTDASSYKLSSYLEHADLPLQHLVDTFRQRFSGTDTP